MLANLKVVVASDNVTSFGITNKRAHSQLKSQLRVLGDTKQDLVERRPFKMLEAKRIKKVPAKALLEFKA